MTLQWHARTSVPRAGSARDLRTLFRRCSAGDARAREAIILRFLPYARRLARRYEGRGEPVEDVYQAASVGLIKAVDRYEPGRGESFVAFARPTILGEIKRHFRDTTWRVHVPRSVQERACQLTRAQDEIRATSGAKASTEVIARHLGLELGEVAEAQGALQANRPGSLDVTDAVEDGQRLTLRETVGEFDSAYERLETSVGWGDALRRLHPRERKVLLLRFGGELTQDEIARRIGVSQMHVSRILRNAAAGLAAASELR
ncbi:MAG: sigma-70 family RNA polymerase sigma factor [Solirubrobacteraceae bacterium]